MASLGENKAWVISSIRSGSRNAPLPLQSVGHDGNVLSGRLCAWRRSSPRSMGFVMSINDTPEIREWFGAFHIDDVRLSYTIAKTGGKKVQELIISNREVRTGLL